MNARTRRFTRRTPDGFVPITQTPVEVSTPDGMLCRFVVDDDGSVSSFTVERSATVVDGAGNELDRPLAPGERAYRVHLGEPVTAGWLRRFKFEATLNEAKRQAAWWSGIELDDARLRGHSADVEVAERRIERIGRIADGRRGRPGLDDRYYAEVARAYIGLIAAGSTAPARDLAERLEVPETTARNQVRAARRRGLLTETDRGKVGGVLTPKANELLNERSV
jgi:hypothetical protein